MCSFDAITGIVLKTNRRTMDFIRHMRRSAFSAGRLGCLIREITWKAGNLYLQNEPVPMHYFSYGFCQSGQRYVSLHAIMVCRTGMKLSPNSVSEYSTFGGISL